VTASDFTEEVKNALRADWSPAPEHLDWHKSEVFKGKVRHHAA
jgi:hypothetical protein